MNTEPQNPKRFPDRGLARVGRVRVPWLVCKTIFVSDTLHPVKWTARKVRWNDWIDPLRSNAKNWKEREICKTTSFRKHATERLFWCFRSVVRMNMARLHCWVREYYESAPLPSLHAPLGGESKGLSNSSKLSLAVNTLCAVTVCQPRQPVSHTIWVGANSRLPKHARCWPPPVNGTLTQPFSIFAPRPPPPPPPLTRLSTHCNSACEFLLASDIVHSLAGVCSPFCSLTYTMHSDNGPAQKQWSQVAPLERPGDCAPLNTITHFLPMPLCVNFCLAYIRQTD